MTMSVVKKPTARVHRGSGMLVFTAPKMKEGQQERMKDPSAEPLALDDVLSNHLVWADSEHDELSYEVENVKKGRVWYRTVFVKLKSGLHLEYNGTSASVKVKWSTDNDLEVEDEKDLWASHTKIATMLVATMNKVGSFCDTGLKSVDQDCSEKGKIIIFQEKHHSQNHKNDVLHKLKKVRSSN